MFAAKIILMCTLLATAALLFFLAYRVAVKQSVGLISGYQKGSAHDEPGLLWFTGRWLSVLGATMIVFGVAFLLLSTRTEVLIWSGVFFAANIGVSAVIVVGQQRYIKGPKA